MDDFTINEEHVGRFLSAVMLGSRDTYVSVIEHTADDLLEHITNSDEFPSGSSSLRKRYARNHAMKIAGELIAYLSSDKDKLRLLSMVTSELNFEVANTCVTFEGGIDILCDICISEDLLDEMMKVGNVLFL